MMKNVLKIIIFLQLGVALCASASECGWTAKRLAFMAGGALLGSVAGPVGTVIGVAIGDKLGGNCGKTTHEVAETKHPVTIVPVDESYAPFDKNGEVAVYFDTASDTITQPDQTILNTVSKVLQEHPTLEIAVVGSADPRATHGYDNQALSERRAASVRSYLENTGGIATQRIFTKGIGAIFNSNQDYSKLRNAKLRLVKKTEKHA